VVRNKRQVDGLKQNLMTTLRACLAKQQNVLPQLRYETVPAIWGFVRMLALVLLLTPLILMACCYCILHKDR
jgi:hypothetical protein